MCILCLNQFAFKCPFLFPPEVLVGKFLSVIHLFAFQLHPFIMPSPVAQVATLALGFGYSALIVPAPLLTLLGVAASYWVNKLWLLRAASSGWIRGASAEAQTRVRRWCHPYQFQLQRNCLPYLFFALIRVVQIVM